MIKNKKTGFTLIELLMVIAIIGILSAIVLVSLSTSREKARDTAKVKSMHEVRSAIELYSNSKGYYPATDDFRSNSITIGSTKFIDSIDKDIIYKGTYSNGSACTDTGAKCTSYHMGIVLERTDNPALKIDKDSTAIFYGASSDCGLSASSPEKCYDIEP